MGNNLRAVNNQQLKWDDIQVAVGRLRLGASAPTWRAYNYGAGAINFDVLGFAVGNIIDFTVQTSHSMKINTILQNHIHFILPNTTNIGDKFQFQLDVKAAGVNGQYAIPTGSPFTAEYTVQANDNTTHRVLEIAEIPAVNTTLSTVYKCKLTRIAATSNEYGSEVYLDFSDCHYQIDDRGSQEQFSK
jgi:hypothetical protein